MVVAIGVYRTHSLFKVKAYLAAQNCQFAVGRHDHIAMLQSRGDRLIGSQGHMHGTIQPPLCRHVKESTHSCACLMLSGPMAAQCQA